MTSYYSPHFHFKKLFSVDFRLVLILLLSSITFPLAFTQNSIIDLKIDIEGIEGSSGQFILDIYTDELSFHREKPWKTIYINKSKINLSFHSVKIALAQGTYGIALIDDKNQDNKINRNFIGYPLEGFGFSNFKLQKLRKPSFKEFSFKLNLAQKHITIPIKYAPRLSIKK